MRGLIAAVVLLVLGTSANAESRHDGSLTVRDHINDMSDWTLDEASGIMVFFRSCKQGSADSVVDAWCYCITEGFRFATKSEVRLMMEAAKSGDMTGIPQIKAISVCQAWLPKRRTMDFPFKPKTRLEDLFGFWQRCRNSESGRRGKQGIIYCNKVAATAERSR